VALAVNQGFAAAVNLGIREATNDWVLILNNDLELGGAFIERLIARAQADGAWFAVGKLFDACHRDIIDGTFDTVCRGGTAWRCGAGRMDSPALQHARRIYFAPFTALLARKELFDRAGPLDERFESYLEDVDFGFRCAKESLSGVYVPEAVAYHEGSGTLGRWRSETVRLISRNQVLLTAKHLSEWNMVWPVIVAQALWGLLALRHGTGTAWLEGKIQGLRMFKQMKAEPVSGATLKESEALMRQIQKQSGALDLYWRLYFALT
jgi:GT2 family glycosyltransferase